MVKNTGSTTVTYEWKKVQRQDFIPSKRSDGIQRFYCHYVSLCILETSLTYNIIATRNHEARRIEGIHILIYLRKGGHVQRGVGASHRATLEQLSSNAVSERNLNLRGRIHREAPKILGGFQ